MLDRLCARRGLDPALASLHSADVGGSGMAISRTADASVLRGRTVRLLTPPLPRPLSPRGPLIKQQSTPSMDVGAGADERRRAATGDVTLPASELVVRVQMPPGSSFKFFSVGLVDPTAADVLKALKQKKALASNVSMQQEWFLYDTDGKAALQPDQLIKPNQSLRLVFNSTAEEDSSSIIEDLYDVDSGLSASVGSGSLYVGSVFTGTRGLSPLRKATDTKKK